MLTSDEYVVRSGMQYGGPGSAGPRYVGGATVRVADPAEADLETQIDFTGVPLGALIGSACNDEILDGNGDLIEVLERLVGRHKLSHSLELLDLAIGVMIDVSSGILKDRIDDDAGEGGDRALAARALLALIVDVAPAATAPDPTDGGDLPIAASASITLSVVAAETPEVRALPDPAFAGQVLHVEQSGAGEIAVTAASPIDADEDTIVAFDADGDLVTLYASGSPLAWKIIAQSGVELS